MPLDAWMIALSLVFMIVSLLYVAGLKKLP
jgi:hypothetical protein